jgi:hypothetical protein
LTESVVRSIPSPDNRERDKVCLRWNSKPGTVK